MSETVSIVEGREGPEVRFEGRVLFLTEDPELIRRQLAGEDLEWDPSIKLREPTAEDPTLGISLVNRGGGIGRVIVSIEGKEVEADARGPVPDPSPRSSGR